MACLRRVFGVGWRVVKARCLPLSSFEITFIRGKYGLFLYVEVLDAGAGRGGLQGLKCKFSLCFGAFAAS